LGLRQERKDASDAAKPLFKEGERDKPGQKLLKGRLHGTKPYPRKVIPCHRKRRKGEKLKEETELGGKDEVSRGESLTINIIPRSLRDPEGGGTGSGRYKKGNRRVEGL